MTERLPLTGRSVWSGAELLAESDWIWRMEAPYLAELDAAIAANRHKAPEAITRADFRLPLMAPLLADINEELEEGRGIARLRGLPVDRYESEDIQRMFWGISQHLGTPVYQNLRGELLSVIQDRSSDPNRHFADETGAKSATAKALSQDALNFHTDTSDVIGLLCVRNAASGGLTKVASTTRAYNEMLAERPDLLEVLFEDWWHLRPEQVPTTFALPLFGIEEGKLTSTFSPANLRKAQEFPGTAPLTEKQKEALDMLLRVKERHSILSPFEPGDAQFLNNHIVSHGRTAFVNEAGTGQSRFMMRVWLATPDSRKLPEKFGVLWGDTAAGAVRGGSPQAEDGRRVANYA
ncbi:TauD/TfdA family dioxygenase [Roseococcus sp. YIM B11640]|uniref:TauD/TfdA family dioxygenase n=1 Tax=Roseococcus sp. YIM B11640 TaxID=3133973 RepID=UPI003C7E8EDC